MIEHAYIHEYGNGKLEPEHKDVKFVLESRKIPVTLFTTKKLERRQLKLHKNTIVIGEIPIVQLALRYLGVEKSNATCYPESLRFMLKRKIWESTIKDVTSKVQMEYFPMGVFVKPKFAAKKFTGVVLFSSNDFYKLEGAPIHTELFCSEVVNWLTEYRIYVIHSKIVGIKNYSGNPEVSLNLKEVEEAIHLFEQSTEKSSAYGIDFGVLENGETALIEWNDGYSLGCYGLDKEVYTDLLLERWKEIMNTLHSNTL